MGLYGNPIKKLPDSFANLKELRKLSVRKRVEVEVLRGIKELEWSDYNITEWD